MKIKVKRYKEIERVAIVEAVQTLLKEQPLAQLGVEVENLKNTLEALVGLGLDEEVAMAALQVVAKDVEAKTTAPLDTTEVTQ